MSCFSAAVRKLSWTVGVREPKKMRSSGYIAREGQKVHVDIEHFRKGNSTRVIDWNQGKQMIVLLQGRNGQGCVEKRHQCRSVQGQSLPTKQLKTVKTPVPRVRWVLLKKSMISLWSVHKSQVSSDRVTGSFFKRFFPFIFWCLISSSNAMSETHVLLVQFPVLCLKTLGLVSLRKLIRFAWCGLLFLSQCLASQFNGGIPKMITGINKPGPFVICHTNRKSQIY